MNSAGEMRICAVEIEQASESALCSKEVVVENHSNSMINGHVPK